MLQLHFYQQMLPELKKKKSMQDFTCWHSKYNPCIVEQHLGTAERGEFVGSHGQKIERKRPTEVFVSIAKSSSNSVRKAKVGFVVLLPLVVLQGQLTTSC